MRIAPETNSALYAPAKANAVPRLELDPNPRRATRFCAVTPAVSSAPRASVVPDGDPVQRVRSFALRFAPLAPATLHARYVAFVTVRSARPRNRPHYRAAAARRRRAS